MTERPADPKVNWLFVAPAPSIAKFKVKPVVLVTPPLRVSFPIELVVPGVITLAPDAPWAVTSPVTMPVPDSVATLALPSPSNKPPVSDRVPLTASVSVPATVAWTVLATVAPAPMVLVALVPPNVTTGAVPATVRTPPGGLDVTVPPLDTNLITVALKPLSANWPSLLIVRPLPPPPV